MKSAKRLPAASVADQIDGDANGDGSAASRLRFRSSRPAAAPKTNMLANAFATTFVLLAGNASAKECVDDASYVSSMGLPCSAYAQLACDGFRHVGWTDQETDELMSRCPSSCRSSFCDEADVNTNAIIRQDRSLSHGHVSDVEQKWAQARASGNTVQNHGKYRMKSTSSEIDKKNLGGTAGGDAINAHLIPPSYCPSSWDDSCKDDPFFHTHVGFHCEAHANLDCTMFESIGFTEQQVYDIINSCPCSCQIECGTWTMSPTNAPTHAPTISAHPTHSPTSAPSARPTVTASASPSSSPTSSPTGSPTSRPTSQPSDAPSGRPTREPSTMPSSAPSHFPTTQPTSQPSEMASAEPSVTASNSPSSPPTGGPTPEPTVTHSAVPSPPPSAHPTPAKSSEPSVTPSATPTGAPTENPTPSPTAAHSSVPTETLSEEPSQTHSSQPSALPSSSPSQQASSSPSAFHSSAPSSSPTSAPSTAPSFHPSSTPTISVEPSAIPTLSSAPSALPSYLPTNIPTISPSAKPSLTHSTSPSSSPSQEPTGSPTHSPSESPSSSPSISPTPASVEMATIFTIPLELNSDITGTDAEAMQSMMKTFLQLNQKFGADNVGANVTIEVADVHVDEIIPRSSSAPVVAGGDDPVVRHRERRMKKSSSSSSKSKKGGERGVTDEDMDITADDIGNRIDSSPTVSIITSEVIAKIRISCNVYPHRPLEVDPSFEFVPRLLGGFAAGDFESYLYQLASLSSTFASPAQEEEPIIADNTNYVDVAAEVDEIDSDSIGGDDSLQEKKKGKGKNVQETLSARTGSIAATTEQTSSNTSDDSVHWWDYVLNNKALFIGAIVGVSMLVMLVVSAAIIGIRRRRIRRSSRDENEFEGSAERPTIFYDEEGRQVIMAPRGPDRYVMSAPTPTNAMWKKQASSTRSKKRYAFSPKGIFDDDSPSGQNNGELSQLEKQWKDLQLEQLDEQQRRDNWEQQQIAGAFPSNKANCDSSSVVGLVIKAEDNEAPNNCNGTKSTPKEKSRVTYNPRSIPVFGSGMFGGQKVPPTTPRRSYFHLDSGGAGSPMSNAPDPPSHPRNALAMQRNQKQ